MPGFVIPSDWAGTVYEEYLVKWPDSPEWTSLLAGQLSTFADIAVWDETTGDEVQAAEIGQDIITVNSTTAIFPQIYTPEQSLKIYTRRFETLTGTPPTPVPTVSPLLLAACNSLEFPATRVTMQFNMIWALGTTVANTFHLRMLDNATSTLYWTANQTVKGGAGWGSLSIQRSWNSLHNVGFTMSPYLDLTCDSNGGTVYYYNHHATLNLTFDLTGDAIDVG